MLTFPRKLWSLFSHRERWQLAGLTAMVLLMGVAQVVSLGSIAPFVSVLVNPESAQSNPWLRVVFDGLGFESTRSFVIFLAFGVLAALIVANSFLALTQWMLSRIGWSLQRRLSRRVLDAYLMEPYVTHLERNSAETGKNVLHEVEHLIMTVVIPSLRLVVSLVMGIVILTALFWASPVLTFLALAVLGGGYSAIYLAVRRILARAGEQRMLANTERYKVVSEAFGGIKETKVLGREATILSQYDGPAGRYAMAQVIHEIVLQTPRFAIEVLAAGLLLILSLFLLGATTDGGINSVAPLLAMYAFAAQRLVPVLQQAYYSIGQIRFNRIVLDTIHDELARQPRLTPAAFDEQHTKTRLPFRRELRLEGLTFSYPGAENPAIQDITVTIPHRSFVAVVGTTGAGKTTFIDTILGLLRPDEGKLIVDGTVLDETNMRAWQNNIGYVPQDIYLTDDSIAANIAFAIPPEERLWESIERSARIANIHDFILDELPNGYETIVGERGVRLSAGQRQRIGIARALYHDPEVLVLDEATSNLDQSTERSVHKAIEQAAAAKTVIMIAHRLSTTRNCDALYLLDHGRLVAQGNYDTLLVSSDQFREMVGTR